MALFKNRLDAGQKLAAALEKFKHTPSAIVLALPRGGVPVGYEVARALDLPLDVFLVRKLGVPGHEELAMGAISTYNIRVINEDIQRMMNVTDEGIAAVAAQEERELQRRERAYRGSLPDIELENRTAIVVDDGMATGATMRAAILAIRTRRPDRVVAAVPTAAADSCRLLKEEADEIICLETPHPFTAVGTWYNDFSQTTDEEVKEYLALAREFGRRN